VALNENTPMSPGKGDLKKHTAVKTGRDGCERKHTVTEPGINGLEVKIPNSLAVC